jgi:hypothetical protein
MRGVTTLVLIGCTSKKLDHAAPARDLYLGRLFAASVAYAESLGAKWFVLSALHGVVGPDDVLEPYDVTLVGADTSQRMTWAAMVSDQLGERFDARQRFIVLAGSEYVRGLERYPGQRVFETPLAGLGVGERYARLVSMRDELEAERSSKAALDEAIGFLRQADAEGGEALLSGPHLRAVLAQLGGAHA